MKNMFESADTFEAYAAIEAGEYMLKKMLTDGSSDVDQAKIIINDIITAKNIIGVSDASEKILLHDIEKFVE